MCLSKKTILIFSLLAMGILSAPVKDENNIPDENVDDIVETDEHHEQEQIIAGPDTLTPLPPISSKKLWPRVAETGMIEVPIEIETDDYSPKQLDVFHEGLADIESKTCVRFVNHTNQKDYVIVRYNGKNECNANIGKIGGPQYLTLTPGCMKLKRKSVHEMIHILGFSHMHQRYDRDDYINIKWDNIVDKYKYAFKRYDNEWEAYGTKYDLESCMHYERSFFTKNKKNTIETIDPYYRNRIGNFPTLSDGDAQRINRMYNCFAPHQ